MKPASTFAYVLATSWYVAGVTAAQIASAARVQDIVTSANRAVDDGEISGVALPLDYVVLNAAEGYEQQLTVRLRLPGVNRDLNVVIDTGSSTLAFCDKSLAEEANIRKINYAQCNQYGVESNTCLDGSVGSSIGYVGQFFEGDVGAYNDQGDQITSMNNVSFAIMEFEQFYACFGPLDGIIGVAHNSLNDVVRLNSPDFDTVSLWDEVCTNPDQAEVSGGYKSIWNCDTGNMTRVDLTPPLKQSLEQDAESGYNNKAFGLYLDYAATVGSVEDIIVPSLGIYFGGDLAYNNQLFNEGTAQVAAVQYCPIDNGEIEYRWYLLNFKAIRVPDLNLVQSTTDLCSNTCDAVCYTDTGNSRILLPLPEDFFDTLLPNDDDDDGDNDDTNKLGYMFIDLEGTNGSNITLSLPLLWLYEQRALGHVELTGHSGPFALGLPIFQYYYLVTDMGNNTMTFIDLQLSSETEMFIDGPELGGLASVYDAANDDNTDEAADKNTGNLHQTLIVNGALFILHALVVLGLS